MARTAPGVVALALLAAGCGGSKFSAAGEGSDDGGPGDAGCADGTREGYLGEARIAACAGAFELPGIVTAASRAPACGRAAGNDGARADGVGCSAADLCAAGYHVCDDAAEVGRLASTGDCPTGGGGAFWLTRQGEDANGACVAGESNNLVGCGVGVGVAAPASCAPLDTELRYTHCQALSSWDCGTSSDANSEGLLVSKVGPGEGGVLCCKD
jgi:hypothetical protein